MKRNSFVQTLDVFPLQETCAQLECVESRTPSFCRLRITNKGETLLKFNICCEEGSRFGIYTRPHLPISIDYFSTNTSFQLETYLTTGMKDKIIILCWQEKDEDKYAIIQPII